MPVFWSIVVAGAIVLFSGRLGWIDKETNKVWAYILLLAIVALNILTVISNHSSETESKRLYASTSRFTIWQDKMSPYQNGITSVWDATTGQMAMTESMFPQPQWSDEQILESSQLLSFMLTSIGAMYNSQLTIAETCNGDEDLDHSQTRAVMQNIQREIRDARNSEDVDRIRSTTMDGFLEVPSLIFRCRRVIEESVGSYVREENKRFATDPTSWEPRVDPDQLDGFANGTEHVDTADRPSGEGNDPGDR